MDKENKKKVKGSLVADAMVGKQNNEGAKTSGIKIRGTGAATKGTMARGPMA